MSDPDREPETRAGSSLGWWVAAIVAIIAIFGVLLLVNRNGARQADHANAAARAQQTVDATSSPPSGAAAQSGRG